MMAMTKIYYSISKKNKIHEGQKAIGMLMGYQSYMKLLKILVSKANKADIDDLTKVVIEASENY